MLAIHLTLAVFAASVAAQITINTPSGALEAIQCAVFQITWTGGTGPFDVRLLDTDGNLVQEIASAATSSPVQWTVNEPAGQVFLFSIHDSTGTTGVSGQFSIESSSDSACLNGSSSSDLTINTPEGALNAIQCEVYQVTWTGGIGPFDLRLLDGAEDLVEEILSNAISSPAQWTVNEPAEQVFMFSVHDSTGSTATTAPFTIQNSSDSSCLNASPTSIPITINTPTGALSAIQCEVFQITWTGGTGPFDLLLLDSASNIVEEVASGVQSSPFQWTVNEPAGQVFSFAVIDSTGLTGLSGQFTIQESSYYSCLSD